MFKSFFRFVYNEKEKRLRGAFLTSVTALYTYAIYSLIAFLIYYSVCIKGEDLSSLTALISAFVVSVAGGHTYNTTSYYSNKTRDRANKYAIGNRESGKAEPTQQEP